MAKGNGNFPKILVTEIRSARIHKTLLGVWSVIMFIEVSGANLPNERGRLAIVPITRDRHASLETGRMQGTSLRSEAELRLAPAVGA